MVPAVSHDFKYRFHCDIVVQPRIGGLLLKGQPMNRTRFLALSAMLSLFVATGAVAGPTISSNTAPGVNFGAYKTYQWVQISPSSNPVIQQEIVASIEQSLASKGLVKADSGDMKLVLTTGVQTQTELESWGRWGLQTSTYTYSTGQLSIDAFDAKTNMALWHGQATETINPQKPDMSKINAAITKLMATFPTTIPGAPPAK
jgi:hypothetical protein